MATIKFEDYEACTLYSPAISLVPTPWSDKIFDDEFVKPIPKVKLPTIDNLLVFSKNFLNAYFGGAYVEENFASTLQALMLGMKMGTTLYIPEKFTNEQGQVLSSPGTINQMTEWNPNDIFVGDARLTHNVDQVTVNVGEDSVTYSARELEESYMEIWEVIEGGTKKQRQALVNYFGYLVIYSLRYLGKTKENVSGGLAIRTLPTAKQFWNNIPLVKKFPPPSSQYIDSFMTTVVKYGPFSNKLLTYIISAYITDNDIGPNVQASLKAGLLLTTGETGLGVIHWANEAAKTLKIPLIVLLESLYFENTATAIEEIVNFLADQGTPGNVQKTWPWARLIKETALCNLGIRTHDLFCLICVYITTQLEEGHPILTAPTVRQVISTASTSMAKGLARGLLTKYLSLDSMTALSDKAREILELAQRDTPDPDEGGEALEF